MQNTLLLCFLGVNSEKLYIIHMCIVKVPLYLVLPSGVGVNFEQNAVYLYGKSMAYVRSSCW